ncbi:MAG: PKD-like domain-containing protein [Chitinophagaceae bacterium]
MRKIYFLLLTMLFAAVSIAQNVTVTGSDAATNAGSPYTTLNAAFTSINASSQTGNNIIVTIVGNTTEPAGGAVLNQSSGPWATMTIQPGGGAARSISGAITAGSPLIDFNGADNVSLDGLNSGGNSLTISNTTASATANTSTIRFINGATTNTVTRCSVLGSSTSANTTGGGNIYFSTTTGGGNNNNTISLCDIGPAGTNLPTKGILSAGTTTSAATWNTSNIINNNNIFDFFIATASVSGIVMSTGNQTCTISNNRIYQTAARTFTSTILRYTGITLTGSTTTASVFSVTGNVIGFGAANGTGTTTISGSTNEIRGIDAPNANSTTVTNIQNNIISGFNQNSARNGTAGNNQCFSGIGFGSGGGLFNVSGNTIGSLDGSSTIVIAQTSVTANTYPVTGIWDFSFNNSVVSNNNIGSITINNGGTGTTTGFRGIFIVGTTGINVTLSGNTIGGAAAGSITDNISGSYAMYAIQATGGPNLTVTNNVVRNMSGNANGAVVTMAGIVVSNAATGASTISSNTIHSLVNTVTGGAAGAIYSMDLTFGSTANTVEKNNVHSINVVSTLTANQLFGIVMRGAGTATFKNNIVRLGLDAAGNPITTGFSFVGIRDIAGATANYYHNSVYIGGSGVVSASNTYCFFSDVVTNNRNFQDNIFWNARSNASGGIGNIAIRVGGTAANPAGLTSNFNDLYFTGTDGVCGVFNGLIVPTLTDWRTATGQDGNSFAANPQFIAPAGTSATGDLHIQPATPTPIESAGTPIAAVTDDFDGQARAALTPTDMGADAGNFIVQDIVGPVIVYTKPASTLCIANRTISATITDPSGVNVAPGTKPRIYFKKSTNANVLPATNDNTTDGWKYTEATNASNPFNLVIDNALIFGGVAGGDIIQYFVVAQDLGATPIVGINTGLFAVQPTSVALTATAFPISGSINNFTFIGGGVSGTVTIGAAGTYPSLTGPGGLFAAINSGGLTANVLANIIDPVIAETGANTLNPINYGCAGTYTLIIKPTVVTTLTGSVTTGLVTLNGADNVTIDGSIGAVPNSICPASVPTRDLTIINTNAGVSSAVVWLQTTAGGDAATNNSIKNCNITGNSNVTTLLGIGSGSSTISITSAGTSNINNQFVNNSITKCQYGIYSGGLSAAVKNTGTIIAQNLMNDPVTANNIKIGGILVRNEDGILIAANKIENITMHDGTTGNTGTTFGIVLGVVPSNSVTVFTGNDVTNALVSNNTIGNIIQLNATGYSAFGIVVNTVTSGTNVVANNMIRDIRTASTANDFCAAIVAGGGTGSITQILHNTISQTGGRNAATFPSYGLAIAGSNPLIIVKNNIFINTQTGSSSGKMYCIGTASATFSNMSSSNNDLYVSGANGFVGQTGGLGTSGTDRLDLAAWQSATGQETNSVSIAPTFVSATDLHLVAGANPLLNAGGTALPVTLDIDCEARDASTPDLGADEIPGCNGAVGGTATGSTAFCVSGTPTITASGYSAGPGSGYQWQSSNDNFVSNIVDIGGQTNPAVLTTGVVSSTTYYRLKVTCASGAATAFSNIVTITINPLPLLFNVTGGGNYCVGGAGVLVGLDGSETGVNYQLQVNAVNTGAPVAGTGAAFSFGLQTTVGTYTVIATKAVTLCTNTMTGSVTVNTNPLPIIGSTVTQPTTCVSADGAIQLSMSGAVGPYTFTWSTIGGSGLVAGQQNQSGLTVGQYNVIVTAANGCQASTGFNLTGPGGCAVCPTIGTVTTSPSGSACVNSTVTLTASGLVSMGVTYGITFKYSTVGLADPYVGGTVIATVPNGSLTAGGTVATTTTNFPVSGNYIIYAILSPVPIDPSCRPVAQAALTVNPLPTVNPVTSQAFCNGTVVPTGTFNFTSPTGGNFNGKLLIIYSDNSQPTQLRNNLLAIAGVIQVDLFDASAGTPSLAQMQQYSMVIPFSNSPYLDPVTLGNNLADYVDANGIVTGLGFTFYVSPYSPTGRWITGNYSPYTSTSNLDVAAHTLGSYTAGHPLMTGVAALNSNFHNVVPLAPGATEVAQWDNGNSLIAYKGRVVGITAYIGSAATWSGDFAKVIVNAGTWLAGGTLTFNWNNNNTTVGLGASGSGTSLPGFTATNAGTTPVTATISVTATYTNGASCTGAPTTFTITVNPTPTVNAVANQTVCRNANTAAVNFSGAVTGTVYNWTNNTTSIGLAASGSGNIASFVALNAGTTPVTATITVTPSYTNAGTTCTGTPKTFTITVNPTPTAIATPASQNVCSGTPITTIALTGAVSGTTYNWTRNNTVTVTGIAASGSGNIAGTLTNTTNAPITVTFTIIPTANGCPGAPVTATVLVTPTPTVSQGGMQVIITGSGDWADEITWTLTNSLGTVVLTGGPYGFSPPPTPSATVPATNAPFSFFIEAQGAFNDNSCLWEVRCDGNIVASGCIKGTNSVSTCPSIGTLTVNNISGCGSNLSPQTICSGSAITPIVLSGTIPGTVFNWTRNNTVAVTGIPASGTGNISGTLTNTTNAPVVVTFTITPSANGCTGTPVTVNITVNPTPNAVATPAAQTICTGTAITPIVLTGGVSGTTYSWTRNNTVAVTGIAASGTGNISGTLTNTTGAPVTVTFTITPSANGCPGTPITATVTVNNLLTITCPANITAPSVVGGCTAVVTYTPVVVGTPPAVLTYVFSGATTGSGSGSGSGAAFNVGVTTVTLTATNSCGLATCSFTITVTDSQLPVISVQPANRTVCAGSTATFTVTASNVVSYQWQQWNGSSWVNVGTNASSFTLNNVVVSQNTNTYRVIINGLCTVVTSNAASLYVNTLPSITLTTSRIPILLPTETVTITATTIPTGGTYTWFRNGVAIPGVTGPVLANLTVDDVGIYRVVYTDPNGCTSTSANLEVSAAVSSDLLVYPNPNDGRFQVRFYNQVNENVTLSVYDAKGARVYHKSVGTLNPYTAIDVDISGRPAGIYIVEVRNSTGKKVGAKRIILGH